jgi:hypothetical protein
MNASTIRVARAPDAALHVAARMLWLAAALALVDPAGAAPGASPSPAGGVHKCRGERGAPVYQDSPCGPGQELRDFATDPPSVSVIPFNADRAAAPATASAPSRRKERTDRRERTAPSRNEEPATAARAAERRHVHAGMTEAEVRARLGPPDMTSGRSGKVRWSYLPAAGDPSTVTTLRLDQGKVVAVERSVVR